MAFKLSKSESAQREQLFEAMRAKFGELEDAINEYNSKLAELREPLQHALDGYNEAVEHARQFAEDIVGEYQGQLDDKSEKGQESERGEAAASWIGEWEAIDLSELEFELPADLEVPEVSHLDEFEALPVEPSE
jgi:chromosome segregation ATPase